MPMPEVEQPAPIFTGVTDDGSEFHLDDLKGNIVVLFFYPRAYTPGCTKEVCSFRDNMVRLVGMGVKVVGVSTDSIKRQAGFKEKHALTFPLIADSDKAIVKLYGVQQAMVGVARRVTFLIDRLGTIRHIWSQVKVSGHVDDIIATIKELGL